PTQLAFTIQPTTATAGAHLAPPVEVAALDAMSNTVPGFTGNVTVTIGTNPAGGTVSGTTTVAAASGVATFSNLSIDKRGTGYTLSAAATPLTGATSAPFDIASSTATRLVFTVEPSTATAGAPITPALQITAQDASGNVVPDFTGNVTVAIGTNPAGGTLSGTTTVAAVGGVAPLPDRSVDEAGSGYTLAAGAAGPAGTTSAPFDITSAPATRLVFTVQPTTTTAGAAISPAVQLTVHDALGNTVTGFTGDVTLTITTGTGTSGARLSGTTTAAAVAGVATFSTLSVDQSGSGYTLTAVATGLTDATTLPFALPVAPATRLAFTVQPGSTTAGAAIAPAVRLTALDARGNPVPG